MISKQEYSDAAHEMWLQNPITQEVLRGLLKQREKVLLRATALASSPAAAELVCRLELVKAYTLEQVVKSLKENKYDNI